MLLRWQWLVLAIVIKHEIDQAELNYKIQVSCVSECSMDLNETT